jgi:hypothetical protein
MNKFDKVLNLSIYILILIYISKYSLDHIQSDFFINYPELNPVNIYFKN